MLCLRGVAINDNAVVFDAERNPSSGACVNYWIKSMKVISADGTKTTIELSDDELRWVNNALNEVCNGIHLEGAFSTRMGGELSEVLKLLAEVHAAFGAHREL